MDEECKIQILNEMENGRREEHTVRIVKFTNNRGDNIWKVRE